MLLCYNFHFLCHKLRNFERYGQLYCNLLIDNYNCVWRVKRIHRIITGGINSVRLFWVEISKIQVSKMITNILNKYFIKTISQYNKTTNNVKFSLSLIFKVEIWRYYYLYYTCNGFRLSNSLYYPEITRYFKRRIIFTEFYLANS